MKTKEILDLDCRFKENEEIIQQVLRQIKPLSKCKGNKVPIEKLEKCIKVLCVKYQIFPRQISPDVFAAHEDIIWKFEAVDIIDLNTILVCYGRNLYEVLAKATIGLYAMTRKRCVNAD